MHRKMVCARFHIDETHLLSLSPYNFYDMPVCHNFCWYVVSLDRIENPTWTWARWCWQIILLWLQGFIGNHKIAVKRLRIPYQHEKEFSQEIECLMKVKHINVVRFIGYCSDTQGQAEKYEDNHVMADSQERLICFEFLPACLDKYIKGRVMYHTNVFFLVIYLLGSVQAYLISCHIFPWLKWIEDIISS